MFYNRICQKCGQLLPQEEMTTLGGVEMCLDCFEEEYRSENTYREHLDGFIRSKKREFLWWLFVGPEAKSDYGDSALTDAEKTDLLLAGVLYWKRMHEEEFRQATIDFSESSPGEWEDYLKGV